MPLELKDKLPPSRCAVVLVDLQNDFCHRDGAWGKIAIDPDLEKAVRSIRSFVSGAHSAGVPVLFLRTIYNAWTISAPIREWWEKLGTGPVCVEGSWGAEFYQVLPSDKDRVVNKYRASGFLETDLDLHLRAKEIQTVLLAGVGVWGGVFETARDAVAKNYYVFLVEDCIAGGKPAERATLIDLFRRYHGEVISSAAVVESWRAPK
ncbi:MAG TPA: isochorismatase family cysteine hydrolase [Candidatus Acidoferrales bacterium]|nr:isochorismatase family cysteine hydrolase [Candidatus Acidoferrales bacterium]